MNIDRIVTPQASNEARWPIFFQNQSIGFNKLNNIVQYVLTKYISVKCYSLKSLEKLGAFLTRICSFKATQNQMHLKSLHISCLSFLKIWATYLGLFRRSSEDKRLPENQKNDDISRPEVTYIIKMLLKSFKFIQKNSSCCFFSFWFEMKRKSCSSLSLNRYLEKFRIRLIEFNKIRYN